MEYKRDNVRLTKPLSWGNTQMAVPLTIPDAFLMYKSTLKCNKLLVDFPDTLDNFLELLPGELRLAMSMTMLMMLLNPSREPANARSEFATTLGFHRRNHSALKFGLVRTFTFSAKDFLDFAESTSSVASENSPPNNVLDEMSQLALGLELFLVEACARRLETLDGRSE